MKRETNASNAPLSWREKMSYGVADMGFNFYWTNIATFLLFFYTDVFGISAGAAASMLFMIKIVNAFTDPMIGALADRTTTRHGKFRPYLVWMALPLAAAAVLTYTTPDLGHDGKLAWAYGTYLLMMVCYTGVNIPYNALSGVMSGDPQERSTINGLRFIFAFAGSTLVTAATPVMVKLLGAGDEQRGWQLAMLAWALAATALFTVTFLNTRERIAPPPAQNSNVAQDIKDLARNRPWVVLFFLALIIMVTITLRTTTAAYYFKYHVGRPELLATFIPAYMMAAAAGAALTPLMTRFVDKKKLLMILMSATALLSSAFFFVPKDAVWLMYALQVAMGFVLGPKSPLAFSMYADTADYNEWRTGRRATAMTFAAATFSQKLGTALAVAVIGSLFTALGYVPNAAQTPGSQAGIVWLMSVIPAFFAALAVAVMFFYNLDKQTLARIQSELSARKP
ncbi:MFS transporter [Pseudoduganella namucuonensis]|uniref:Glycoside/pentoside/hexuronide:cation symporter, GPH family n=1 Tax=Pseudoduganella namucuonensis TaxID=1035707 RepID=A0A1I7M2N5_9BURK|nr:MFS transporter [Pseudoduganella namucuonensis]SFV16201.1 glycoside/pentoside/hexuronide:cation symporter, GPH family [Pseudoduganella namucuonensis]